MKKKLLSVVLALAMVLSLMPMAWAKGEAASAGSGSGSVARIGDTEYDSLQAAVEASGVNPTEVLLLKDTQETITINNGQNIILNLGGKVLSQSGNVNTLINDGAVKIQNGTIEGKEQPYDGAYTVYNRLGEMTIEADVTVTGVRGALYNAHVPAKLTINGGTFTATLFHALYVQHGTVVVNEGNFTGGTYSGFGVHAASKGGVTEVVGNETYAGTDSTTINGGTYSGDISKMQNVTIPGNRKVIKNEGNSTYTVVEKDEKFEVISFSTSYGTFETLQDALDIASAQMGTVKLLTDVSDCAGGKITGSSVTIDLNGNSLSGGTDAKLTVNDGVYLTI